MKRFAHLLAAGLVLTAAGVQAQQTSPSAKPAPRPSAKPGETAPLPLTDAVVERVIRASGEIVLQHEDLPNLAMPAMTMAFNVGNKKMLDAVKPGDKVRFQAEIVKGAPTITHMELAR
jgi:Cu(I)/Ag(I) efflux system membrane protein CusA/SilA